jgi:hypothetical protein
MFSLRVYTWNLSLTWPTAVKSRRTHRVERWSPSWSSGYPNLLHVRVACLDLDVCREFRLPQLGIVQRYQDDWETDAIAKTVSSGRRKTAYLPCSFYPIVQRDHTALAASTSQQTQDHLRRLSSFMDNSTLKTNLMKMKVICLGVRLECKFRAVPSPRTC